MELRALVGVALGAFAESLEGVSCLGLVLGVEFEYHFTDLLFTLGDGQVHSWVGWVAVVVHGPKAALSKVENLFCVHFFHN